MFEIFSEVRAVLSPNAISFIDGCVIDAIKKCVFTASVEQVTSENGIQYHLCGTLDGILIAKTKLEELLNNIQLRRLAKESSERDSTTFSEENSSIADEGTTSYDKEGTDKTSCLSDDKERDTNASSNGYISTNTESSVKTMRKPLSKKLRFILKERPRISQRTKSARLAMQLRSLKKKSILRNKPLRPLGILENDPDKLSENLQQMKLVTTATEDSDFDSTEQDGRKSKVPADSVSPKEKNYEANSPYKHFCELCSFKTKRSSHFMKHKAIHEKISTLYRCSKCTFTSVRLGHLRRHEMTHSSTVHNCSECHYKTDDAKFLLRHVKLKHRSVDKNSSVVLSCPHCSYQTTKQHYYDRHQRLHCSKRSFIHQCEQCCYKTHRKEHFVRHVNNVHGNNRNYLCHLCGKAFKRGDALLQHYQTHSEIVPSENSNFKCNICQKAFRSHSHLYEHQAVHSEFRSFLCEMCGASFKTRSVHRKHVLSIHRNPRAYSCDSCPKKFNTLFGLKRHQKTHMVKSSLPTSTTEADDDPASKEIETALTNLKTCYTEPCLPVVTIPNATVVQPMNSSVEIAPVPFPEVPVTNAEMFHQMTPALLQTSDATTLLYLTSNLPQL